MPVLCGMPTIIQYSTRSHRLSVHKLFTSCIWRGIVSRDSIVNGDWLPVTELCQCYLPCCQPVSEVAENLGRFLYGVYRPGEWLELIPMVKMETINPIKGYFGSELPEICDHCGVMVAWSRKVLKPFDKFLHSLFGKTTPDGKIFKILLRTFSLPAVANVQIVPKISQSQPPTMYSKLQISSKSVHFRRSYNQTREHDQNVL